MKTTLKNGDYFKNGDSLTNKNSLKSVKDLRIEDNNKKDKLKSEE